MAQVNWSNNAAIDLQDIETYIAEEEYAPLNAIRFIDSLIDHVETILRIQPFSGRNVPELENSTHNFLKEIIFKGHRICTSRSNNNFSSKWTNGFA